VKQPLSRDELEGTVRRAHHLREEHRRARVGSRARRRLHAYLLEAERDFERLLAEWVTDDSVSVAWRAHLYERGPEPDEPVPRPPLVFRGRSASGSIVEIRERQDGDCSVEVDGSPSERIEAETEFAGRHARHTFALGSSLFRETFAVSPRALAALREFVAEREPHPPWRYGAELAEDGLVDRDFALTARGSRALATPTRRSR
jgi:hypothetical protein